MYPPVKQQSSFCESINGKQPNHNTNNTLLLFGNKKFPISVETFDFYHELFFFQKYPYRPPVNVKYYRAVVSFLRKYNTSDMYLGVCINMC